MTAQRVHRERRDSCLVVKEGKTSDEVVAGVHASYEHLGVVTEKLKDSDHCKASVLELLGLLGGKLLRNHVRVGVAEGEDSPVVDGADEEEHLQPAKGGNSVNSSKSVGNGGEGDAGGDLTGELVYLRHDVSNDGKLGNTAVLQLSSSVLVEGGLVLVPRR